jgi:hypothetical protein
MAWKNWGDHPVIVGITVIASLCGVAAFGYTIYDHMKPEVGQDVSSAETSDLIAIDSSSVPRADITQPLDLSIVDRQIKATGTLSGLPTGYVLWVYVYPSTVKKFYPSRATYDAETKKWQCFLTIGSIEKENSGVDFEIGVLVANKKVSGELNKMRDGTSELPLGTVRLVRTLTVKRK